MKDLTLKKVSKDSRGNIYILEGMETYPELTIFQTKSNKARGGCVHNINDEICTVISGRVTYVIGDRVESGKVGESITIPKGTPHYFFSNTDSVVIEWGAIPEEKKFKHKEFRAIVDKLNDTTD